MPLLLEVRGGKGNGGQKKKKYKYIHFKILSFFNLFETIKEMLNVNPMQLTHHHGPEFHLDLENEDVVLHGSAEESAGVVLRGSVTLNCLEQTKIKSVTLKFIGMTYVNWTEGTVCLILVGMVTSFFYLCLFDRFRCSSEAL